MAYIEGARVKRLRITEQWRSLWSVQFRYYQSVTGRKYLRSQKRLTDVKYLSNRRIRGTRRWESFFDIYPVGTMWQVVLGLYLYLFSFKPITAKNYLKLCKWKLLRRPKYKNTNRNTFADLEVNTKNLLDRIKRGVFSWVGTMLILSIS
jgi:hypothetical protein